MTLNISSYFTFSFPYPFWKSINSDPMFLIVLLSFYYGMLGIKVKGPDQLADSQIVSLMLWVSFEVCKHFNESKYNFIYFYSCFL